MLTRPILTGAWVKAFESSNQRGIKRISPTPKPSIDTYTFIFMTPDSSWNPTTTEWPSGYTWTTSDGGTTWTCAIEKTAAVSFAEKLTEGNVELVSTDFDGENCDKMFFKCSALTGFSVGCFQTATSAVSMFAESGIKSIPERAFSNLINASMMFAQCTSLTGSIKLAFNKVTNGERMFVNCTSLTETPANSLNLVIDANTMFAGCTSIEKINTGSFYYAENTYSMFAGCTNLTTCGTGMFNNVKTAQSMFGGCLKLESIPSYCFINLINGSTMFGGCASLTTVNLDTSFTNFTNDSTKSASENSMTSMFVGCSNLTDNAITLLSRFASDTAKYKGAYNGDNKLSDYSSAFSKYPLAFS